MNNFAVSSDGLATALQTSASALMGAGNSLEQSVALVAASNKVLQDPSQVGAALRTIALRIRGTSIETLQEMGEETDGVVTSVSKLQNKVKSITGVDILDSNGAYRDTYEILRDLAEVWDEIGQKDPKGQAAVLELLAGKNRANALSAILTNLEDLEGAYESALGAENSAFKENETYMQSIQGHIDQFNNSVQTMWYDELDSSLIKGFVDLGKAIVEVIDKIGLLGTAFIGISLYGTMFKKFPQMFGKLDGQLTIFGQKVSDIKNNMQQATTAGGKFAAMFGRGPKGGVDLTGTLGSTKELEDKFANVFASYTGGQNEADWSKYVDSLNDYTAAEKDLLKTQGQLGKGFENSDEALTAYNKGVIAANAKTKTFTWSQIGLTIATTALNAALSMGIGLLINLVIEGIDRAIHRTEYLVDDWNEAKDKVEELNSELETTRDRIDELQSKGSLSFVEQSELNELKKANEELERNLRLQKEAEEIAGKEAREALEKDFNKSKYYYTGSGLDEAGFVSEATKNNNKAMMVDSAYKLLLNGATWNSLNEEYQKVLEEVIPEVANSLKLGANNNTSMFNLSQGMQQQLHNAGNDAAKTIASMESTLLGQNLTAEQYVNAILNDMAEWEKTIFDANGRIKDGVTDEQFNEYLARKKENEDSLALVAGDIVDVLNQYGDIDNEFTRENNAILEQIDQRLNPTEFYQDKLDEIFGKHSEEQKQLFKLAEQGALTTEEVINGQYDALLAELTQYGIYAEDLVNHINSLNADQIQEVLDPEFMMGNYADQVSSIQENISTYQSYLEKIYSGTFVAEDLLAIMQQFPGIVEEIDPTNMGELTQYLEETIKSEPDELIEELEALRDELKALGKDTTGVDAALSALEDLPTNAVDNLTDSYVTLGDVINEAKIAQNELKEAMEEEETGYETRGTAIDKMESLLKEGKIGSESELWDIAEAFGFTYDSSKIINENADALDNFISIRKKWYAKDDDGNYTYTGTENFIEAAEKALKDNDLGVVWEYDDGVLNVDFDNADWDKIAEYLAGTEELAGLTSEEFKDLISQIGQFFDVKWENMDDISTHLNEIANSAEEGTVKLKKYKTAMESALGKDTKIDITNRPVISGEEMRQARWEEYDGDYATFYSQAYSNQDETATITVTPILPDGQILSPDALEEHAQAIIDGADPATYEFELAGKKYTGDDILLAKHEGQDSIEQAATYGSTLSKASDTLLSIADPYNIATTIITEGVQDLGVNVFALADAVKTVDGMTVVNTDLFTSVLREAGYTDQIVQDLIDSILEYEDVLAVTDSDPFAINTGSLENTEAALKAMGIVFNEIYSISGDTKIGLNIEANDVIQELKAKGWTEGEINAYLQQVTKNGNIQISGQVNLSAEEADALIDSYNETPVEVTYDITEAEEGKMQKILNALNEWPKLVQTNFAIVPKLGNVDWSKYGITTVFGTNPSNGIVGVNGTAHAQGSWGAPRTEQALVGELGPEVVVRGNRWFTVGNNGAEFADIRKNDIIFNHLQSKQLLSHGYVTANGGRGKAYASGTAYNTISGMVRTSGGGNSSSNSNSNNTEEESKQLVDFIEYKLEEIEDAISKATAKVENFVDDTSQEDDKRAYYNEIIAKQQEKMQTNYAAISAYSAKAAEALRKVPAQYQDMAKNGAIAISEFVGEGQTQIAENIEEYREWSQKADEAEIAALEGIAEISKQRLEAIQDIADDYDHLTEAIESQSSLLQANMDLIEESGQRLSEQYYNELIKHSDKTIEDLEKKQKTVRSELNKAVENGEIKVGSDDWYELVNLIIECDEQIIECKQNTEEWNNAINDLKWSNLEKFITELDNVDSEISNLYDLLSDDDQVVDDMAEWTNEGITSLGLLAQQMELAQYKSEQYGDAIEDLKADYKKGLYSTDEYNEKLAELTANQWDSIKAYESAKDAIVDLNKVRVDAVKEGIKKEIDAYKELIDKKKELLDSDKDEKDFQESILEKQKAIATIRRQLIAIENNNSAEATAKRKQLQAQLAEETKSLDDLYYDRNIETQKESLDKEYEAFEANKNQEMEVLDQWLEQQNQVIAESFELIKNNATIVLETMNATANEYGIQISSAISTPWQDGANAVYAYSDSFNSTISDLSASADSFIAKLNEIKQAQANIVASANKTASDTIESVNTSIANANESKDITPKPKPTTSTPAASKPATTSKPALTTGSYVQVKPGTRWYETSAGNGKSGNARGGTITYVNKNGTHGYNIEGLGWVKQSDIVGYAKGTTGVKSDQLAWIDEMGLEEIVLHAGDNGRLQYLSKGSAVLPHSISENLMEIGKFDPTELLDRSKPQIGMPSLTTNNTEINLDFGSLITVNGNVNDDTLPKLQNIVRTEFNSLMSQLNAATKKFTR